MARAKRRPEPEPEVDDEVEIEPTERDYVMARLAAGRAAAQAAINAIDESLHFFINPDDDKTGKHRRDMLEEALEAAGVVCRALECAEEVIPEVDFKECEPWEEEEDGDEEEEDADDDDDE